MQFIKAMLSCSQKKILTSLSSLLNNNFTHKFVLFIVTVHIIYCIQRSIHKIGDVETKMIYDNVNQSFEIIYLKKEVFA